MKTRTATKPATMTLAERAALASNRVLEAEAKNMSQSTVNRRYRELFAAQDACKASGVWS